MCRQLLFALVFTLTIASLARAGVEADVALLRLADGSMAASPELQSAWKRLANARSSELTKLLTAMQDAKPIAQNWLRSAVDAAAEKSLATGDFPMDAMRAFLADESNSPRARRTAFEWIVRVDSSAATPLLNAMLEDQSLSLRYDAVAQLLEAAKSAGSNKQALYEKALVASRDPEQIGSIAGELKKLGVEVDVPKVLGFVLNWRVVGPFDNTGLAHFNTAYAPETDTEISGPYNGKKGEIEWSGTLTAQGDGGQVNLVQALGAEKEAIAYAYTTIEVDAEEAASDGTEIRYESRNATKVWLNGKLIASHEVYHSGSGFDQYRVPVTLRAGQNTLLIKVCQNEQKMPWEREWDFRLRVVDALSTPIGKQPPRVSHKPNAKPR